MNWTGTQFFVIFLQQIKCPRHSTLGRVMAVSQTIPGRSSLFPPGVPSSSPTLFLTSQCSGDSPDHSCTVITLRCTTLLLYNKNPIFSWNYDRFVIIFYSLSVSRLNFCSLFNFIHNKQNFVRKRMALCAPLKSLSSFPLCNVIILSREEEM